MKRRSSGQSIVEMAFVLPVLLIVLFGIIEFGYIIYAYSTVSQAARNGAEAAAQLPPYQSWLAYGPNKMPAGSNLAFTADGCVRAVYNAVQSDQTLFDIVNKGTITISYPADTASNDTRNLEDRGPIEVTVSYPVTGITPLFQLMRIGGSNGTITLKVTQRRSLESLGVDPSKPSGVACAKNVADYNQLNP